LNHASTHLGHQLGDSKKVLQPLQPDLFESMVAVVFESTFYAEMHQNDIFSVFKNYF